jgi:phosphoglycerate dehydrogenase-like enzyme
MAPFRVALSSDFQTPSGAPAYPMFDLAPLSATGIEYEYVPCVPGQGAEPLTVPASSVEGFDALILLAATFTADSIPSDGRLKIVARFGVGFNVDVAACSAAGIVTCITPDGVRRPVAVTVVNFLLSLASKLRAKERLARTDDWGSRSEYMGVGVTGKTLGLLGLGNIGAEICMLIHPFDVRTIAYDPFVDEATAAAVGVELVDLDTLFETSDFVSVNCPLNDETEGMVHSTFDSIRAFPSTQSFLIPSRSPTRSHERAHET